MCSDVVKVPLWKAFSDSVCIVLEGLHAVLLEISYPYI